MGRYLRMSSKLGVFLGVSIDSLINCCFFLIVFCFGLLTLSPQCWCEEQDGESKSWEEYLSVTSRTTFRYRSQEGDRDSDIYEHWFLRADGLLDDHLDLYFSGRLHKDIDGTSQYLSEDIFASIEDRDTGWESQVYQLYADFHARDRMFGLRLGRQYIEEAYYLHLDAVQFRLFEKEPVGGSLFFGRPVSYYSPTSDDWAGGGALQVRPWQGGRSRFTYVRYDEDEPSVEDDDLYSLDFWQYFGTRAYIHGKLSFLDDQFHQAAVDFLYFSPDGLYDLMLGARHWGGLRKESREYSPLFSVLGELEEYTFLSARLTCAISSWTSLSLGGAARLVDGSKRDVRNRQYGNTDLTLLLEPHRHWTVSLSGEYWDISGGDRFWGTTGEVEYRPSRVWKVSAGTAYLDYRYEQESDFGYTVENGDIVGHFDGGATYVTQISPDVYTFFARGRVHLTRSLTLRVEGEIENNDLEDENSYGIRTSLSARF